MRLNDVIHDYIQKVKADRYYNSYDNYNSVTSRMDTKEEALKFAQEQLVIELLSQQYSYSEKLKELKIKLDQLPHYQFLKNQVASCCRVLSVGAGKEKYEEIKKEIYNEALSRNLEENNDSKFQEIKQNFDGAINGIIYAKTYFPELFKDKDENS